MNWLIRIKTTKTFQFISTGFANIQAVAVGAFRQAKLSGLGTFAALRASASATSAHISWSFHLASMNIKASMMSAKKWVIGTSLATSTAFLNMGTVAKGSFRHARKAGAGMFAAIGASAKAIWSHLGWVKHLASLKGFTLAGLWKAISGIAIIGPILKGIAAAAAALGGAITAPFVAIAAAVAGIAILMIRNWQKVKQYFIALWNFFKALFGFIVTIIRFIIHMIDQKFPIIGKILGGIGNAISGFFVGIWNIFKGIASWIENVFVKTLEWVTDKIEKITGWLKKFTHFMKTKIAVDKAVTTEEKTVQKEVEKTTEQIEDKTDLQKKNKEMFKRQEITSEGAKKGTAGQGFSRAQSSIQFVNFTGIADIQTTLESGFQTLANIDSAILDVLTGGKGAVKIDQINRTITPLQKSSTNSVISNTVDKQIVKSTEKGLQTTLPTISKTDSLVRDTVRVTEKGLQASLPAVSNMSPNSINEVEIDPNNPISIVLPEPSVGEPNSSQASNGANITINVNPDPGMNIDELVEKMKRELEKEMKLNQFGQS